jgi:hypothetical protein
MGMDRTIYLCRVGGQDEPYGRPSLFIGRSRKVGRKSKLLDGEPSAEKAKCAFKYTLFRTSRLIVHTIPALRRRFVRHTIIAPWIV